MKQEFDKYSLDYQDILDKNLKITGYDSTSLAFKKAGKLKSLNLSLCDEAITVLDYGCGTGHFCLGLKKYFPKAKYTGVDISQKMISAAKEKYGELGEFYEIGSSEWTSLSFDIIFSAGTFHHIPHQEHEKILTGFIPLLKPSGKIFIWEHNPLNPLTRKIVKDCVFDEDAVLIPAKKMKALLEKLRLGSPKIIYTTFFPQALDILSPLESILGWCPIGGQYIAVGKKPS